MVFGEKRIQVVITSGLRDKVRQEMLFFSNYFYRNKMCLLVYPLDRPFAILYKAYHAQSNIISSV